MIFTLRCKARDHALHKCWLYLNSTPTPSPSPSISKSRIPFCCRHIEISLPSPTSCAGPPSPIRYLLHDASTNDGATTAARSSLRIITALVPVKHLWHLLRTMDLPLPAHHRHLLHLNLAILLCRLGSHATAICSSAHQSCCSTLYC